MIDCHLHLFERGFHGTTPPDEDVRGYQQLRQQYGVSRGLVIGYEGQDRFAGNNDYVCRLARAHDWIIPLLYLDRERLAGDPGLPASLLTQGGAGWVSYLIGAEAAHAWDRLDDAVWDALDAPVPWSLNIDPAALAVLTPRLARLRHTTVLVSHLGLPSRASGTPAERLEPVIAAVRAGGRIRVKVSGLYALADPGHAAPFTAAVPYLRELRDRIGIEHLAWGSDYTPMLSRQDFASQVDLSGYGVFSDAELAALTTDDLTGVLGA